MGIKIFIDQGHNPGTINAGSSGFGLEEAEVTYEVGMLLADLLRMNPAFEVRTSRNDPKEVLGYDQASSLRTRVAMANTWPADYFISIHCNWNMNPNINGTEVYIYRYGSQANWLAQDVLNGIVEEVQTKDNLVRQNSSLYVLRRTTMPAILVELAYLSNEQDAMKLKQNPQGFATGIYNGILTYFGMN